MANFKGLDRAAKRAKLSQIIGFMYQQNAPAGADAFGELRACYPDKFPISKNELEFREYFAWAAIDEQSRHPAVRHVLMQG